MTLSGSAHWFRSGDDWCAAFWHQASAPVTRVAVLCPSIGQEHLRGQRHYRALASRLAASGVSALRFDYPATGNSTGDAIATEGEPVDLSERWCAAIRDAVTHVRGLAPAAEIFLIGRRVGALLAARASRDIDGGVAACVMWDPVQSGGAQLRELRLREAARLDVLFANELDRVDPGVAFQSEGHRFNAATVDGLSRLSLDTLRPCAAAVHVVGAPSNRVRQVLAAWNTEADRSGVSIRETSDSAFDWANPEDAALPEETLEAIYAIATAAMSPCVDRTRPTFDAPAEITIGDPVHGIRERLQRFSDGDALFGVVSVRADVSSPTISLLILGTGVEPTPGIGDSWTRFAREAAARGIGVLRIDYAGNGESLMRPGGRENCSYQLHRADDVRNGVDWLRARWPDSRVVVTGICTGGFYGVHGASAGAGMDAVIAINPQLWCSETSSINVTPDVDVFAARRSAVAARDVNKWMRLLRGGYRLSDVVQALRGTMKRVAGSLNGGADGESTLGGGLPRLDLVALFPPDVPMHLVFSEDDFGYEHLLAHGQARLEKLFEQPHLHLHRIAGVDHTFSREWMRKVLDEEVLELLAKL